MIDTSVIIEWERDGRFATTLTEDAASEPTAVSSVTVVELLVGVARATPLELQRRRERFISDLLKQVAVVPFDLSAARIYGGLSARLLAGGNAIGALDLMIAASALANGYDLLTLNYREFDRVPGLVVRRLEQ